MSPVGPGARSWAAVLDELDAQVASAWALLTDDVEADLSAAVAWTPPVDLGPCPAALRERAVAVLRAQSSLEEGLARRMAALEREAQGGRRRPAVASAPRTRFVDQLA